MFGVWNWTGRVGNESVNILANVRAVGIGWCKKKVMASSAGKVVSVAHVDVKRKR